MTDIYIDPITHDIVITDSKASLITEKDILTRQRLDITLKTFKGEWAYNINFGVPYLANDNNSLQLLEKGNTELLEAHLRSAIAAVDGIEKLVSLDISTSENRAATATFSAITETGDLINETLSL